ncbi:MAG: glycoside hydrolase family 3 C-terminal domain-containing protein, partial [Gemmatimonadaceae bacterium]
DMLGLRRNRFVDLSHVRQVVGDSEHVAIANRIADRGIVLVRDTNNAVPLVREGQGSRIYSLSYARRADLGAGVAFNNYLRSKSMQITNDIVISDDPGSSFTRALERARASDIVIVSNYVNVTSETATASVDNAFTDFVRELVRERAGAGVVVVTFGTPYLLQQIADAPSYMIAWGSHVASQHAAARALLGEIDITATLPISIPPLHSIGDGERRSARLTP